MYFKWIKDLCNKQVDYHVSQCHRSQLFENAFQPIKKIYNYVYNYNYSIGLLGCFINFKKL